MTKKIKIVVAAIVTFLVLVVIGGSFSVVGPTDVGVIITLGEVKGTVDSGLHFKAPFISRIKTYDLTPILYKASLGIGTDGAITADKQTIGIDYELYWKYDGNKIEEVAKKYSNKDAIYEPISTALRSIVKDETGRISVDELVQNQTVLSTKAENRLKEAVAYLPVIITQVSITNFDWSDDYDKQLKETANRTQQVKIAQQDAEIAAATAQKKVKEAEADKQAAELNAQAEVAKANGEAQAQKIRADAQAYENQKIAQNLSVMQAQWKHEEQLSYYGRWNGVSVSNQSVYVPNTYTLKDGK